MTTDQQQEARWEKRPQEVLAPGSVVTINTSDGREIAAFVDEADADSIIRDHGQADVAEDLCTRLGVYTPEEARKTVASLQHYYWEGLKAEALRAENAELVALVREAQSWIGIAQHQCLVPGNEQGTDAWLNRAQAALDAAPEGKQE